MRALQIGLLEMELQTMRRELQRQAGEHRWWQERQRAIFAEEFARHAHQERLALAMVSGVGGLLGLWLAPRLVGVVTSAFALNTPELGGHLTLGVRLLSGLMVVVPTVRCVALQPPQVRLAHQPRVWKMRSLGKLPRLLWAGRGLNW